MIHEIPEMSAVKNIRMPYQYRQSPELIKAYLTGFMNAWQLARQMQQEGEHPTIRTSDDF